MFNKIDFNRIEMSKWKDIAKEKPEQKQEFMIKDKTGNSPLQHKSLDHKKESKSNLIFRALNL